MRRGKEGKRTDRGQGSEGEVRRKEGRRPDKGQGSEGEVRKRKEWIQDGREEAMERWEKRGWNEEGGLMLNKSVCPLSHQSESDSWQTYLSFEWVLAGILAELVGHTLSDLRDASRVWQAIVLAAVHSSLHGFIDSRVGREVAKYSRVACD